jgi:glycosyltransferase involved in cell wall biosynthesis
MMIEHITPVILTYNEERNITRTLSKLAWARDVVVVDSGSVDGTLAAISKFPKVRVFNRPFDTHANQWRYAIERTGISTEWILRLDADYQIVDALVEELTQLKPNKETSAYRIGFDYAVFSHRLRTSLYPSNTILLRRGAFSLRDKGHTEVWDVRGPVLILGATVVHDDWKPTGQWVVSQVRYMQRELEWLRVRQRGLVRFLRLGPPLMPIAVFLYCLFGKGLILNGRAGLFYALQRMVAEAILSLLVLEEKLCDRAMVSRRDDADML